MYTNDLSNCQQDVDAYLFNSKFIAPIQYSEPLHPPVPSSKIRDTNIRLIVIFSSQTLLTVEEAIIIIYIAGYISHKITRMVCSKCTAGLVGLLNKANSSHVFIPAKQYQDLPNVGLVVPSSDLMEVCTLIEAKFLNNIEKILHMNKVSSILVSLMLSKIQGLCNYDFKFKIHILDDSISK